MGLFDKLFHRNTTPDSAATLGRNEPCWCGSGKKYKRCHFTADQDHLARLTAKNCKTAG